MTLAAFFPGLGGAATKPKGKGKGKGKGASSEAGTSGQASAAGASADGSTGGAAAGDGDQVMADVSGDAGTALIQPLAAPSRASKHESPLLARTAALGVTAESIDAALASGKGAAQGLGLGLRAVPSQQRRSKRVRAPTGDLLSGYKLLQFAENHRPAYWGTFSKPSTLLSARRPFARDTSIFNYDVRRCRRGGVVVGSRANYLCVCYNKGG